MDNPDNLSEVAKIFGGIGLMAFASAVWYELRQQRLERSKETLAMQQAMVAMKDAVAAVRETLAGILENIRHQAHSRKED